MNREEKNLRTRRKIIDSALQEFGKNGYGKTSMNGIRAAGDLSKGILYHYFKDKDELYLVCVKECFDALTECLKSKVTVNGASIEAALENYFDARITFFGSHPLHLKLFSSAVLHPPAHLLGAIAEAKTGLDDLNTSALTALLKKVKLRPGATVGETVEIFREYQDFVNTRFQMQAVGENTLEEHEERRRRSLKVLLYGVIERHTPV